MVRNGNITRQLFRQELGPRYNVQRVRSGNAARSTRSAALQRQERMQREARGARRNRWVRRSGRGRLEGRVVNGHFVPY